ncbi:MAG: arylsulfatase [Planctomycetes bacterium]|nr:arylsulfatase [Planctomycetota bacterium]
MHPSLSRAAAGPTGAADGARRRPNVLVIVADDMGFSDAGAYGGEIRTPVLDRLAANGLRFTQGYSTARCWPSRACILTGYYAQHIRRDTLPGLKLGARPAWARLLPERLKPLGYRCYHSGKWHIDGLPVAGGFDRSYLLADQDRYFSPRNHREDDRPLPAVEPESGYYATVAIADRAVRCLREHAEEHADRPFFLYLAFTCPHFPLHALEEDIARCRGRYRDGWDAMRERRWLRMRAMGLVDCGLSARDPAARAWRDLSAAERDAWEVRMAIHAAMIERMDREIGRVIDRIRAMGALDDTVIFFVSDNGASAERILRGDGHDPTAPPGSWRSYLCIETAWANLANAPFRRHKIWVHEGGISSPWIVHWPAGIRAHGELRRDVCHLIDLAPTILDLAGAPPADARQGMPGPPMHGRSIAPAFARDGALARDALCWFHSGNRAIRAGDWKLVAEGAKGPWELYDLAADRCESNDLAARAPDRVKDLADRWTAWEADARKTAVEG